MAVRIALSYYTRKQKVLSNLTISNIDSHCKETYLFCVLICFEFKELFTFLDVMTPEMKTLTHIKCRLLRTDTDWSTNKSDDDDDSANFNDDQMTVMIIMTTTMIIESEDDDDDDDYDARWQGTEATKMATAR